MLNCFFRLRVQPGTAGFNSVAELLRGAKRLRVLVLPPSATLMFPLPATTFFVCSPRHCALETHSGLGICHEKYTFLQTPHQSW